LATAPRINGCSQPSCTVQIKTETAVVHQNIVNPRFVMAWLPLGVVLESDHKKAHAQLRSPRAALLARARQRSELFFGLAGKRATAWSVLHR
jgi:hypothetical protein